MAFTRVLGPGIHTASNINSHNINSTGIITAVSFVGDGSGLTGVASTDSIITGTAATFNTYPVDINAGMTVAGVATFSGNLTVGGVLTYEDVKNVDSIGVITARNGIDCNGDIDVDGQTNLDHVSIAGITTFTNGFIDFKPGNGGNAHFRILSTGSGEAGIFFDAANGDIAGSDYVFIGQKNNLDFVINPNANAGNIDFQRAGTTQLRIDTSGNLNVNYDLDVDGHTNLDNVSIVGVTTFNLSNHSEPLKIISNNTAGNISTYLFTANSGLHDIRFEHNYGGNWNNHDHMRLIWSAPNETTQYTTGDLFSIQPISGVSGFARVEYKLNDESTGLVDSYWQAYEYHQWKIRNSVVFLLNQAGIGVTNRIFHYGYNNDFIQFGHHNMTFHIGSATDRRVLIQSNQVQFSNLANGVDINADLDVDGHTNLDNVSIVGVATVTGSNINMEGGSGSQTQLKINSTGRYRGVQLDENGTRKAHFQHDATDNKTVVGTAEGTLQFNSGDTPRITLNSSGHWVPYVDSNYDLGLSGTRWRNVYADTLYGDGSNLTGITQTTINSNVNNYLITGTGTANTLQGESNLTYNGTLLTATGSNEADIFQLSTGNGSSDTFAGFRGDNRAGIRIRGGGSQRGGEIELGGGQRSSDPAVIKFSTTTGTSFTERFRIASNGNVSVGNNPTVHADTIFHIEDSGETNVKVEGSTSTLGARISLQNNDTTANSYSQYAFNDAGGQSTSAIQGINTDQTNNYGELAFLTRNAQGTPPQERMRITKDGAIGISPASCTPTAGDLATGDSQNVPIIHVKGSGSSATGGVYNLLSRFEAGGDADGTGAMIVLNHSNDRGLALQGGRSVGNRSHGAIMSIDNIGRLSNAIKIYGGNGAGVNELSFYTGESSTTTKRLNIDSTGALQHTASSGVSYFTGSSEYVFGSASSSPSSGGAEAKFQIHDYKTRATLSLNAYMNNAGAPFLQFVSSRSGTPGTLGTKAALNDYHGDIRFFGDNGTNYQTLVQSAQILVRQKSTISDGDTVCAGEMSFYTGTDSAGSMLERLKIDSGGRLTQTSTDSFLIAKGNTSERPTGTVGMLRFNTETDQLENYTSAGWRNVNLKVPTITQISGEIYAGMPSNITINGNDFDATVTVIFKEGSTTRATLTGQSVTSGSLTVTVPSGVYGQSVGDTITITITNTDGVVSAGSNKTIQSTPTGGTTSTSGNYRVHTFTSSGTLTAPSGWSTSYDYLLVAGGGSGGNNKIGSYENGGGGGAGGMLTGSSTLSAGSYSINIGQGGAIPGGDGQTKGGNTTAFGLTAIGGGGGRTRDTGLTNCNGGSGGGTTNWDDVNSPGSGTSGQGNRGGYATQVGSGDGGSGGGGGKGAVGGTGQSSNGAAGGSGQASSISGSSVTYAGGGGGGGGSAGSGGSGGGGTGGSSSSNNGSNGTTNRGGGGGGNYAPSGNAGNGGAGIVIVRYKLI